MPSSHSTQEHQQFNPRQQTTNSSPSSSIVTVQRAASIGPSRSIPRPLASLQDIQTSTKGSNGTANFSKPVKSREPRRRQSTTHSRSSSVNGVRDGIGNLNRWSQSTTSSKGSTSHTRSDSFSRRMSFGGSGSFTFTAAPSQSPNKSNKTRPSAAESPSRQPATGRPGEAPSNPATSLPPLVTLSISQQVANPKSSPLTAASSTPSTAGLLSAAVHTLVPDYFSSKTWEQTAPREFTQPKIRDRSPIDALQSSTVYATKDHPASSPSKRRRQEVENSQGRGHSRNRSEVGKTSSGTQSSDKSKERATKQPSQKAMLSIALQKANTAVLLDNAQNFEGAVQAYAEACDLLQQVMMRSSGDDDKRKLDTIRNTYTTRIQDLEKMAPLLNNEGKALPARPQSSGKDDTGQSPIDYDETAEIGTAMVTRIVNDDSYVPGPQPRQIPALQVPKRRESLLASAFDPYKGTKNLPSQNVPQRSYSRSPMREKPLETTVKLAPPMEVEYMPPPLSPHRPLSPAGKSVPVSDSERRKPDASQMFSSSDTSPMKGHKRPASVESMSWLDMIDGSGGSTASSVHSRTSSLGVRRKHIRAASGATEAEFDAALDAAVEAAYDDGFEPVDDEEEAPPIKDFEDEVPDVKDYDDDVVANVRRRVEQAKERVRQTAREAAIQLARDRERTRQLQEEQERYHNFDADYDANESEEEERMLDEMTKGYVMDDFEFGLQSKSALPRESDSSGFSGRTWNSSIGSNPTTAGTSLSTVAETSFLPEMPPLLSKTPPPMHLPPTQSLPPPPPVSGSEVSTQSTGQPVNPPTTLSVRSRRLSGQNPKQLKIETTTRVPPVPTAPLTLPPLSSMQASQASSNSTMQPPLAAGTMPLPRQSPAGASVRPPVPQTTRQASSPFPGPNTSEFISPPTPTLTRVSTRDGENCILPRSGSPGRAQSRSGLRKNFSSSSLKNMKNRNLSISNLDDGSDGSPITPSTNHFGGSLANKDGTGRLPAMPTMPTPIAASFRDKMNGLPTGGLYLFDSDINAPESPGSPGLKKGGAPIPLEPCPNELLLRPFWLMRALYQTLAHPRGGYLSTKLFVPTDVWRVKGVKIKNLEDKISNCDYLTAALQKLAQVDTCDADAVLDEMQSLETVLEQVQIALTKKLGNEVGVQGSGVLFKDAPAGLDGEAAASGSKTPGGGNKSSFSWRRLRSKNSNMGMANNYSSKTPTLDGPKEGPTMSTLPMTSLATIRFAKRDLSEVQFSGPHANYMGALARLFDAAQVIDQIARQVEDPGLRHADKTQVGLELSTRHAAEFFGFYVCRFVLADVSLLLDKFIKRGSEWVLV